MARYHVRRLILAASIVVLLLTVVTTVVASASAHARRLLQQPVVSREFSVSARDNAWSPAISGKFVVWEHLQPGGRLRNDIVGKDLMTGRTFIVAAGTVANSPVISGRLVVWDDCRYCKVTRDAMGYYIIHNVKIYGKDLVTGREFLIASPADATPSPAISGQIVVWQDICKGQPCIYGKNVATGREFVISRHRAAPSQVAISGRIVIWMDNRNGVVGIYGKNLSTGQTFLIVPSKEVGANLRDPKISGHIVLWTDWDVDRADQPACIYARDLSTGHEFHVATIPYGHFNPQLGPSTALDGNLVVWDEVAHLSSRAPNYDIYGKNLLAGPSFRITQDIHNQQAPAISGTTVVWEDSRRGGQYIYGAVLSLSAT